MKLFSFPQVFEMKLVFSTRSDNAPDGGLLLGKVKLMLSFDPLS